MMVFRYMYYLCTLKTTTSLRVLLYYVLFSNKCLSVCRDWKVTYQTNSFICKESCPKIQWQFLIGLVCRSGILIGKTSDDVLEDDDQSHCIQDIRKHCKWGKMYKVPD